jgi:hypothetical protein
MLWRLKTLVNLKGFTMFFGGKLSPLTELDQVNLISTTLVNKVKAGGVS